MSMRSDWVAAKTRAKGLNNGKTIKFKKDLGLGKALDKFEAADKVRDKKSSDLGPAWAKAVDEWAKAAKEALRIAKIYYAELQAMPIPDATKRPMDTAITMHIFKDTIAATDEAERLEPTLKKHRKK